MEAFIAKIDPVSSDHWYGGLAYTIYFAGCDFKCPYCNTPEMLETKEDYLRDLREIKNDIKQYRSSIKAIVFTGGEPCLQRQSLLQLAAFAKDLELKTGLETNGSKTETIRSLINLNVIDFIALDLKSPPKADQFQRATKSRTFFKSSEELINDIKKTIVLLENSKVDTEVRTTIVPSINSRKEDIFGIADQIEQLNCTYLLQQFSPDDTIGRFKKINAPSQNFIRELSDSVQKRYPKLRITCQ